MDQLLTMTCLGAFLLLPIIVLSFRAVRPKRMPWWAAIPTVIVLGWLMVLAMAVLNETPDGGAPKVLALFFGWVYALVWFVPWLLVYGVVQLIRRWRGDRSA